jgi:hypothetical protein
MLNDSRELNIKDNLFEPKVKAQIQSIFYQLQANQREFAATREQEQRILAKLSRLMPDLDK